MGKSCILLHSQQDALTDKLCNTLKTITTELVCQHLQGRPSEKAHQSEGEVTEFNFKKGAIARKLLADKGSCGLQKYCICCGITLLNPALIFILNI